MSSNYMSMSSGKFPNKTPIKKTKGQKAFTGLVVLLLLQLILGATNHALKAQQAVVTLDRSQMLIGQHVTLQLKVENITGEAQQLASWFKVIDTAGHIEVLKKNKIDTINIEGQITLMQKITITSFDSGKWVIPVVNPVIKDVNGQAYDLRSDPVTLDVMPVDVSGLKDFHPEKDILSVDYKNYTWIYITGGVLLLAFLAFIIYRLIKRRAGRAKPAKQVIKGPPLEWALGQIDKLVAEELLVAGKAKEFYTRLNDICRTYFDERIKSHTFQSTSKEMIDKLGAFLTRQKDRVALQDFTALSDFVKFAEHLPEQQKTAEAVEIAKETLRNIEKQVLDTNKQNDL